MDHELLEAGIEVIRELAKNRNIKLPDSSHKAIATQMIKSDKLGENDWCNTKISLENQRIHGKLEYSKKKNFYPFINVGFGACLWIKDNYGDWTLDVMKKKLKNPIDAYTNWTVRFAATMKTIGPRECEASNDLHSLVTTHPNWNEVGDEMRAWRKHLRKLKKKRLH